MRLAGLRFFPAVDEAQEELVIALQEVATDDDHAREIISGWIHENTNVPTPAHIYAMLPENRTSEDGSDPHAEWRPPWLNGGTCKC
jgi:hypothetical protein